MAIKKETIENHPKFTEYRHSIKGVSIFVCYKDMRAICFYGRSTKHSWYRRFNDYYEMIAYIENILKKEYIKIQKKNNKKQEMKTYAKASRSNVQIGDIFYTSWGYNSTIVEFFQVIDKPSPCAVIIRQVDKVFVEGNSMYGRVKSVPNVFILPEKKCRLDIHGNVCNADKYGHKAYRTSAEKSHHVSCD